MQPTLFPPGWAVAWADGPRRGRSGFAAEADARLAALCLAATLSERCRVRLYGPDGRCVEELRWQAGKVRATAREP